VCAGCFFLLVFCSQECWLTSSLADSSHIRPEPWCERVLSRETTSFAANCGHFAILSLSFPSLSFPSLSFPSLSFPNLTAERSGFARNLRSVRVIHNSVRVPPTSIGFVPHCSVRSGEESWEIQTIVG
jgi:hypothetical protein